MADEAKEFRFGIEAEFLLAERETFAPLWHDSLSFERLNAILEAIPLEGLPSCQGLELKPPMRKVLPFVIEGYLLPGEPPVLLPKGVEIRTPVCSSIGECLSVFASLHERLDGAMAAHGLALVALSHHPTATSFHGPQNDPRHDYWQWGMEVMTTYGPDINIGLPARLEARFDPLDFEDKVNHYGPALAALTAASPFCANEPWKIRGGVGKSFRLHKRSYIAPAIELHPEEDGRIEFKLYDMPGSTEELGALLTVSLALVLDGNLRGRASKQSRIYDLGQVARLGLGADSVRERVAELLTSAPEALRAHGFDPAPLELFRRRLETGRAPADDMLGLYARDGRLTEVLRERSRFPASYQ